MTGPSRSWTLCVDFGTAYSKAAAAPSAAWSRFDPALVRPLTLGAHEPDTNAFLLDSAVFVDDDRILFGRAALARAEELGSRKRTALRSFKTLLSVSDLDRALNTSAPASIDPHRAFPMRDLIVLYLAYLLSAVERATAADPMLAAAGRLERRYAAPAWRSGDSAGSHASIVRLFGEAEAFRQAVGERLLSPKGVPLRLVADALPSALAAPLPYDMGLIYEATAAAAYTSIGLTDSAPFLIVVDMGAGTTDFAAVAQTRGRVEDIAEARQTLKQAGDFLDRIVANLVLDASRVRSTAQQSELWRLLMARMQDIKESLFHDGRAVIRHGGKAVSLSMRDLERDREFRDFNTDLAHSYDHCLEVVRAVGGPRGRRLVQAVAVGGGAAAPFVQALLRRKPRGKLTVEPRPATPEWAFAPEFRGNLAPVFPQLAIAIGGALAPDTMLAVRNQLNPAAGGRTDIRAEPD